MIDRLFRFGDFVISWGHGDWIPWIPFQDLDTWIPGYLNLAEDPCGFGFFCISASWIDDLSCPEA
jgi:hypothetical protein